MITYVNTVFVSNNASGTLSTSLTSGNKGQFIVWDVDKNAAADATSARIKIGMFDGKTSKQINPSTGATSNIPSIKWSNIINVNDIKGFAYTPAPNTDAVTEDKIVINFTGATGLIGSGKLLSTAGKRIIVRLTFKDLPTRYRKWTESYEYITKDGDTAATIATGIANLINKEWKRARVTATAASGVVTLEAMPYDDDNSVDTINWADKVRFNANVYYTDPAAEGWESLNKHYPTGVTITKTPGKTFVGNGKLVRDREAQAMGYLGILNRGEGTWPIIKPAMETDINENYNVLTLEFENMYRTADDLFRKTKQTVEIYAKAALTAITNILEQKEAEQQGQS
jgi:hypothetical protein